MCQYTDMLIAWSHVSVLVYLYIVKLLIMKRIIPAILLLLSLTGCYNSGEPRERVLKIYNWADYIGDGVLEDFKHIIKNRQAKISASFIRHSTLTR